MTIAPPRRLVILLAAFVLVGAAQAAHLSTADGVYSRQQADQGRDLWAYACQSCHAPTQHAGPVFRGRWFGRTLGELFGYLRREMPQTDPGTMSDVEYAALIAYLMRINGMPAAARTLAADSVALHRIRIDSVVTASTPPGSRR
ncbi:MAG: c-type cytochrome [Gemmatimonadaceae bacterium]